MFPSTYSLIRSNIPETFHPDLNCPNVGIRWHQGASIFARVWDSYSPGDSRIFADARDIRDSLRSPSRRRQSVVCRTCVLPWRILRNLDFRLVHKFGNSFAWRISISFRAHGLPEPATLLEGATAPPTIPLIARTSCRGVLTRKPIYSNDNIDAGAPVRPGISRIWFRIMLGSDVAPSSVRFNTISAGYPSLLSRG